MSQYKTQRQAYGITIAGGILTPVVVQGADQWSLVTALHILLISGIMGGIALSILNGSPIYKNINIQNNALGNESRKKKKQRLKMNNK